MENDRIKPVDVASELSTSFLDYSMSVIISRALPDVRDGLKPSQRRILYAMKELNLSPGSKTRKCSKIVGDTMGNYHPHGDAAIYGTLVNMAQDWSLRDILVIGQGNFGTPDGDPPAAARYTEAKLSGMGVELMADLNKDTVDFVPTYDNEHMEPTVFPSAFPNLLVNGGTGIAVGMATNMPTHNLGEVVDGICATIDNPHITIEELKRYIKGPDFPTGGDILGFSGIDSYFRTGRGSVRIRGKIEIEQTKTGKDLLIIKEVPYGVNRSALQERIAELYKEKILTDIVGIRDLSDRQTHIEIELKRDARPQVVMNQLYKLTSMETSFAVNMLAIHDNRPKTLSMPEAINFYIEHRREVIVRRTRFELGEAEKAAERLEAFLLALGHMDDFIRIIRDSKNREEARERLQSYTFPVATAESLGILIRSQPSVQGDRYVFTERQVNAILDLRLYQLTSMENDKVVDEYGKLIVSIKDLMDILANESRVLSIVKDELQAIKAKYATPRITRIIPFAGDMSMEDLIPNDSMIVTISHSGYIKRTNAMEYRVQARGGKGVKAASSKKNEETDFIEHLFAAQNHDYLMFFTNTGRVYVDRVYEIDEAARSAQGRSIKNLLDLQPDESIATILRLERKTDENGKDITFAEGSGSVVFATKNGTVKKSFLNDFVNYRKAGIIAINLEEGNSLVNVVLTGGNDELVVVTRNGQSIRFHESNCRDQGRNTRGVRGIKLKDAEDCVVAAAVVDPQKSLLVVAENGLGKRSSFDDYRSQSRGGSGIKTMNCTDKTGKVVSATVVSDEDELMLMTTAGQSVRIKMSTLTDKGRNTQGVKLMTLNEGESIQDISLVIPDDEEEVEESEPTEESVENTDKTSVDDAIIEEALNPSDTEE